MTLRVVLIVTLISFAIGAGAAGFAGVFSIFHASRLPLFLCVALFVEALLLYGIFDWKAPVFGRVFWKGPAGSSAVSITFDDGPNEPYTSRVLDVLKTLDVKATFFVLGENVEVFPDAVRRAIAEGHEIGNHTYDHGVLPLKGPGYIGDQIRRTGDIVERMTGVRPRLFRAPHGWRNPWVNRCAARARCLPVAWTWGVWDTDRPGVNVIVRRALKGLTGGCVLLLHDGRGTEHGADASQLVEALPGIVRGARQAGYRFLTLSEMLKETVRK